MRQFEDECLVYAILRQYFGNMVAALKCAMKQDAEHDDSDSEPDNIDIKPAPASWQREITKILYLDSEHESEGRSDRERDGLDVISDEEQSKR